MSLAGLDEGVKHCLERHLINIHGYGSKTADALKIETIEQINIAARILFSDTVSSCFNWDNMPFSYPVLPKHNYLVACVFGSLDAEVIAIYSLNQMQAMESTRRSKDVHCIIWGVLELSKKLESNLLGDGA